MKLLCLSDLHLRQEAVVDAIDRQRLSPFLAQIAATVVEVSPDAVVKSLMCRPFPASVTLPGRSAYFLPIRSRLTFGTDSTILLFGIFCSENNGVFDEENIVQKNS